MCLSITLAVVAITGFASIPFLIVLALCIGTVNAVDMPVRQSFAVEMVGREDIGNAVALNSAMFNSARVIGPAVAGLVIGAVGVAAAFVIDAVSFLAVIAALLAMRESELHPAARIERPESFGGGHDPAARGSRIRPDDPGGPHRRPGGRPGRDVRPQLHGHHPAVRRGRARTATPPGTAS